MQRNLYKITHNKDLHVGVNKISFSDRRHDTVSWRQSLHGFTLVELLVVISIIALLLSILMPSLLKVREQAKKTICLSNLRSLAQGAIVYANSNKDFLPNTSSPATGGYYNSNYSDYYGNWYFYFEYNSYGDAGGFIGLGKLIESNIVENSSDAMFCPAFRGLNSFYGKGQKWARKYLTNSRGNPQHFNYVGPGSISGNTMRPADSSFGWTNLASSYQMRPLEALSPSRQRLSQAGNRSFISDTWCAYDYVWGWMSCMNDMPHNSRNSPYGGINAAFTDGHAESFKLKQRVFFDSGFFKRGLTWKMLFDN